MLAQNAIMYGENVDKSVMMEDIICYKSIYQFNLYVFMLESCHKIKGMILYVYYFQYFSSPLLLY